MRLVRAKSIPVFAAATVAGIGAAVLSGWIFNCEPLMTVVPGLIRMKSNTAATLLIAGGALYLASTQKHRPLRAICAAMVALVGVVTLVEYECHVSAGIDQILFRDPVQFQFPGRMAPISAVNFILTGAMLYPFRFRLLERLTDAVALILCADSTLAVVGYLYGVPLLYGSIRYTAMAVHTGAAFLCLSVGFLCIQKEHGFARIFQAQTAGGIVARQLIPPAILIPIVVGAVFNRFNFGQLRLGIAFIVVCNMLLAVASIWGLARALDKSEVERGMAQRASEIDALTGVHNRRYFDHRLLQEIQRCTRYSRHSCLILFDIDHFKNINDRFGHQSGDEVLTTIAQACAKSLRATDVVCRYGGEEFAIIAPETGGEDAMLLARKIRVLVSLLHFHKVPIRITISLGVAQIGRTTATPEVAVAAADKALFAAKTLGRNCECLYGGIGIPELASATQ